MICCSRQVRGWLWPAVFLAVLLTGCATAPLQYQDLEPPGEDQARSVELSETPFFPQTAYHCGPSALATLLKNSGVTKADPVALADQVYLPAQRGSLQTELLAATRRADRVPYVLEPKLEDLLNEVRAGNPVLVLQNLKLPNWPQWHYAVVVGFDLDANRVVLRSGKTERETVSMRRFERTWQLGDYWALVVPEPGQIPATATANRYLQAVAALEQQQRWRAASEAYRAAIDRWPDNAAGLIGLGNVAYHEQEYAEAQAQFHAATQLVPDMPAAHYNLAWALARQGKLEAARQAAAQAEALAPEHPRFGRALSAIEEAEDQKPQH